MTFTDTTPTPIQHRSDGRGLRVGGVIALALAGLVLLGAAGLLAVHCGQRDSDGYYRSAAVGVSSNGYAVSSAGLDIGSLNSAETFVTHRLVKRVRISASTTSGKPIFLGLARRSELDAYLSGSARTLVSDVRDDHTPIAHDLGGGALSAAPASQSFWLVKASGRGELTIDWNVRSGRWALAVLNADGSPRTAADVRIAVKTDALLWLGLALLGLGLVTGVGGAALIAASRRSRSQGDGSGSAPDDLSVANEEA